MHNCVVECFAILSRPAEQQMDMVAHQNKRIDHNSRELEKNERYRIHSINIILLVPEQQFLLQLLGIDLKARFHVFCFKVRSTFTFYKE